MKTWLLTSAYLVGIGEIILAMYFWITNSKNDIRRVMALLALSTSMWVITSALVAYRPDINPTPPTMNGAVYTFGILLVTSLLHFTIIYPFKTFLFDKFHAFLLYVPTIIFSVAALTTKSIEIGTVASSLDAGHGIPGPLYSIYNIYVFLLFVISCMVLLAKIPALDGLHKRNTKIVATSIIIGGLPGVAVDLVLPVLGIYNVNFLTGVLATGAWLGAILFIILKRT